MPVGSVRIHEGADVIAVRAGSFIGVIPAIVNLI